MIWYLVMYSLGALGMFVFFGWALGREQRATKKRTAAQANAVEILDQTFSIGDLTVAVRVKPDTLTATDFIAGAKARGYAHVRTTDVAPDGAASTLIFERVPA